MKVRIFVFVFFLLVSCAQATEKPYESDSDHPNSTLVNDSSIQTPISGSLLDLLDQDDIILQYDHMGGLMGPGPGTNLPLWTLYSDGLLVWSEDGLPTPGFTRQIWVGHLNKVEIEELMSYVDAQGFWELDSTIQPDQFIEPTLSDEDNPDEYSAFKPNPEAALDQPSSTILVSSIDKRYQVTVFPAGWQGAPEAYQNLQMYILNILPDDAKPFVPETFSLRAREIPQIDESGPQVIEWPFESIKLVTVVESPISLDGEQGTNVAGFILANGQQVFQNSKVYVVTLLAAPPRRK